jgi:hypothetical protein
MNEMNSLVPPLIALFKRANPKDDNKKYLKANMFISIKSNKKFEQTILFNLSQNGLVGFFILNDD